MGLTVGLITNYLSAGSGQRTAFDVTRRSGEWNATTQQLESSINIVEATEWTGLSEQAAIDFAAVGSARGSLSFTVTNSSVVLLKFGRQPQYQTREDKRTVGSFIVSRSVETTIEMFASPTGPRISVGNGKKTYPFNVVLTASSGATVSGFGVVDYYGDSVDIAQQGTWTGSGTRTVTITKPSILLAWSSVGNATRMDTGSIVLYV